MVAGACRLGYCMSIAVEAGDAVLPLKPSLTIVSLTLSSFRNYDSARLEPSGGADCPVWPQWSRQDQPARSHIIADTGVVACAALAFDDILMSGSDRGWAVSALLDTPAGEVRLGTAWQPAAADNGEPVSAGSREVRIDGQVQRGSGSLADHRSAPFG